MPATKFKEDLISEMESWRAQRESLILMIDANENMSNGKLSTMLKGKNWKWLMLLEKGWD